MFKFIYRLWCRRTLIQVRGLASIGSFFISAFGPSRRFRHLDHFRF
jgi:hypothetical protein